jgi:amidophosphoribosyltransferase
VRYSTTGETILRNVQPLFSELDAGGFAVGHNGNLTNGLTLRRQLVRDGAICQSTSDTEVILHLYARSHRERLEDAIAASLSKVMGAFSLLFLTPDALVAARDPWGFRPLVIGRLEGATIICSETCALDLIDAEYVRDIEPGELVVVDREGLRSFRPFPPEPARQCVFEHVYFARPDSQVFGRNVLASRLLLGRQLAREAPADADIVVPVPDSGMGAALGYSQESGLPFQWGLIRNHYVGRTFIEPKQAIRSFGVKIKLNPVREILEGKRVILIDDSIVRGTTSRKIVGMVRAAGAAEVHVRVSSPPTTGPCYYGIDTPLKSELIASSHSVDEICRYIGADSLRYLSQEGLLAAVGDPDGTRHCSACFSGRYPVAVPKPEDWQLRLLFESRQLGSKA